MCYNKLPMIPIFTLEIICASFSQMQNDTSLHFKNDFYISSSSEENNSSENLDGYRSDYSTASTINLDESIRKIFIYKCKDLVKKEIDLKLEDGYNEEENDQKKEESKESRENISFNDEKQKILPFENSSASLLNDKENIKKNSFSFKRKIDTNDNNNTNSSNKRFKRE